ncbi:hypothetical protein CTA2_12376 [Colletotrichum tanaceti]|uniref:Uncharacterized protein n=1 Tax=Colletotrichum tanaceti TaxID=1306861 RepID=A0A4U6WZL5_9PEZI|nr:hypothetical protein CTA2_12376 [Colletotrichum tanaceti]TKW48335.1 hypothetical protein CTA1_5114 [Colletotrichum tanaceti]
MTRQHQFHRLGVIRVPHPAAHANGPSSGPCCSSTPSCWVRESDGSVGWRTLLGLPPGRDVPDGDQRAADGLGPDRLPADGALQLGLQHADPGPVLAGTRVAGLDRVLATMGRTEAHFQLAARGLLRGDAGGDADRPDAQGHRVVRQGRRQHRPARRAGLGSGRRLRDVPRHRRHPRSAATTVYAAASARDELVQGAQARLMALADQTPIEMAAPSSKRCPNRQPSAIECDGPCCLLIGGYVGERPEGDGRRRDV